MDINTIKERYRKNYITDAQLARFVALGIITDEQAEELRGEKAQVGGER